MVKTLPVITITGEVTDEMVNGAIEMAEPLATEMWLVIGGVVVVLRGTDADQVGLQDALLEARAHEWNALQSWMKKRPLDTDPIRLPPEAARIKSIDKILEGLYPES